MNDAAIIGYGMVGKAFAKVFGIKKIFTRNSEDCTITLTEAAACKFVFICLPTPVDDQGNYFLDDILAIIKQLKDFGSPIIVIRSTVNPGFAARVKNDIGIDVVSNPEFLSEDTAEKDTKNPPFILLGGKKDLVDEVRGLYEARIKGAPVIVTDNQTAEMAKLTLNAYFATKVIFANDAYDSCEIVGANYETVKKVLEAHPYGPKNHFTVWYKGKRGVNGNCLPKDSRAYASYFNSKLLKKVVELNELYVSQTI